MAVNQQQLPQVLEARYGKVTRHDRLQTGAEFQMGPESSVDAAVQVRVLFFSYLHAFLTGDPDADISRSDHVDVICTIT